ncbi:MAG: Rpn family recombination-promoting nuclease/putative transposase [Leptolyngbya sp.]|nr:Rpn family recombination-promoting nuclease/putative transposase [Leptolyngbya sp.]
MKTDSLFYALFQSQPSLFFELIGQPTSAAQGYQFASVEVKQTAFRIDGVFLPPNDRTEAPVYFVEVQFQRDPLLYRRLFAEVFLYLKQYPEVAHWQAVVVYPRATIEIQEIAPFGALLASAYVQVIYLDQLGTVADLPPGLATLRLIVEPEATVPAAARDLIDRVRTAPIPDTEKIRLVELIETIVVYTFPRRSRQEIAAMLGLSDLKETRFYQETREEALRDGREEGLREGLRAGLRAGRKAEAESLIIRQLTRKLGSHLPEALQEQVKQLPLETLESLGEALFDLATLADLETWLAQNPPAP